MKEKNKEFYKNLKKGGVFLLSFFYLFLPIFSFSAGLVPCGGPGEDPCSLCHLFVLLNNIFQFIIVEIVPLIAVVLIVIGGLLFLLRAEDPNMVNKAKSIFQSIAVGLVLILSAWLIVGFFLTIIGVAEIDLSKNWFRINCP